MSETVAPSSVNRTVPLARAVTTVAGGAVLMTLAAKTQIPFWPVPMTLQTMAVMAVAVAVGPRLAVGVVAAYLAAGALGLPVFAGSPERGVGLAYMTGPTGGYLLGYLAAAWLVGVLAAGRGLLGRSAVMIAGMVPVYALGAAWLALWVPADRIFAVGILPFLLGDLVKIGIVAAAGSALPAVLARLRGTGR